MKFFHLWKNIFQLIAQFKFLLTLVFCMPMTLFIWIKFKAIMNNPGFHKNIRTRLIWGKQHLGSCSARSERGQLGLLIMKTQPSVNPPQQLPLIVMLFTAVLMKMIWVRRDINSAALRRIWSTS